MPSCEGRPEGPCPEGRNEYSVHGTQGDLMLCHACDEYRFPTTRNDTRSAKTSKQSAAVLTRAEKRLVIQSLRQSAILDRQVPMVQMFMQPCNSRQVLPMSS